jgi:photosystem II stability/assembly factor-like uncharacterized protein
MMLCGSVSAIADSDPPVNIVFHGTPHDALFDIEFQGETGLAVGSYGLILTSSDGGLTWMVGKPLGDATLTSVAMSSERAIAVGQSGIIFVSDDSGKSWQKTESGVEDRFMSVALAPSGESVAVGGFGLILKSLDWGHTWNRIQLDWETITADGYEPHLYDIEMISPTRFLISGEFGLVLSSDNAGGSWEVRHRGDASLFSMSFPTPDLGFAVGQDGTILKTNDQGNSWQSVEIDGNANLLGVWASKHGEIVVTGVRSFLRSSDGGDTWEDNQHPSISRTWFQDLAAVEVEHKSEGNKIIEQKIYTAGYGGSIALVLR